MLSVGAIDEQRWVKQALWSSIRFANALELLATSMVRLADCWPASSASSSPPRDPNQLPMISLGGRWPTHAAGARHPATRSYPLA